jgi:hypothetical protein
MKDDKLKVEKDVNFSDFDLLEELGCLASLPSDEQKLQTFLSYSGLAALPSKDGKFVPSSEPSKFNVK